MRSKTERFIVWLKMFWVLKGYGGKHYWLFRYRPSKYSTWKEFKDSLIEKK